jgi:RecJ-like exonuclease
MGVVRSDGIAKISARCSKLLFLRGLDMGAAIREAAETVGGEGGGHAVACGAQVEEKFLDEFVREFEERMLRQLSQH